MAYQNTFKRYELKYLVTMEQKKLLLEAMMPYMKLDEYGRSLITNIYFDTPNFLLARRSMEKPVYKEKLRLRSYGVAKEDSKVFIEIKKKYKGVVYKRRISSDYRTAVNYLCDNQGISMNSQCGRHSENDNITCSNRAIDQNNQIKKEIDYFLALYKDLEPAVYLSYEREAFYGFQDRELRITFDENILWRQENLSLCVNPYGESITAPGMSLMEIKITGAMPLWLSSLLSDNYIFQTSFSKYGTAYRQILEQDPGRQHVSEQHLKDEYVPGQHASAEYATEVKRAG